MKRVRLYLPVMVRLISERNCANIVEDFSQILGETHIVLLLGYEITVIMLGHFGWLR